MRIIYFIIIIFIFSLCAQAKEKNNILNKKEIVILGLTLVNPAISTETIVSNTTTFQKIISMANTLFIQIEKDILLLRQPSHKVQIKIA